MRAIHQVGTRKTSVARATLTPGNGMVRINKQLITTLPDNMFKNKILEPSTLAGDVPKKVDIKVEIHGGGQSTQADAARLAIAKTLAAYDDSLQNTFLEYDRTLLVADVRRKESIVFWKKYIGDDYNTILSKAMYSYYRIKSLIRKCLLYIIRPLDKKKIRNLYHYPCK